MILRAGSRGTLPAGGTSPLLEGLVGFWEFEADGSDSSDNGHDFNVYNTPVYGAGLVNNAITLDFTNSEYLDIADSDAISLGGEQFEFAFWFYLDGTTGSSIHTLVNKKTSFSASADEYQLQIINALTTPQLSLYIGDGTSHPNLVSGTFSANAWTLCRFGWDGANAFLSVNNGAPTTAALSTTLNTGGALTLARNAPGAVYFFDGRFDSMGFWKTRTLTADERTWFYNAGSGRSWSDLLAYRG